MICVKYAASVSCIFASDQCHRVQAKGSRHASRTVVIAYGADSSEPRKEQWRPESANESLASRLQAAAPSSEAYTQFRAQAAALLRNGKGTPLDLYQEFVSLYGQSDDSLLLFLDLAELSPDQSLRSELISVAGFDVIVADAEPSTTEVAAVPEVGIKDHDTGVPDTSRTQSTEASQPKSSLANMPLSHNDSATRHLDSTISTETAAQLPPAEQSIHGAPEPIANPLGPESSDPPEEHPNKPCQPAQAQDNPEEALQNLGFSSELWGVDAESTESSGRGAKRKRGRRAAGAEAGGGTLALSLLEHGTTAGATGVAPTPERPSVVYWIRQDFRLHDNPALCRAVKLAQAGGGKVLCVYVHSPGMLRAGHPCGAQGGADSRCC